VENFANFFNKLFLAFLFQNQRICYRVIIFELIILARWQRLATQKITVSTYQLSTRWFRNLQWKKWASTQSGGWVFFIF
jgi:hypothetical protein